MPAKKVWLNLPVKDIKKSKAFFDKLGFITEREHANTDFSCPVLIGAETKFFIMLFTEEKFNSFTRSPLSNSRESAEMLISLDAESREEIDEYARKATAAGGMNCSCMLYVVWTVTLFLLIFQNYGVNLFIYLILQPMSSLHLKRRTVVFMAAVSRISMVIAGTSFSWTLRRWLELEVRNVANLMLSV
jgi:predicted lactoylglutathione lyase